jgi:hypothetical protein
MALLGVWGRPEVHAMETQLPAASTQKPVILPPENADIAALSRAENLFWCDVMMEHASFFAMLMPGAELAKQRGEAERFQLSFQTQYDRARTARLDLTNYVEFNRATIELLKPLIDYKVRMRDAQSSGKIHSLVYPLFFDHTAREARQAMKRLERLASGDTALNYADVVDFWAADVSDHSDLIGHFLDPQEEDFVAQATDSSALFKGFKLGNKERTIPIGDVVLATEDFIDFETAVQDGMNEGRVKGILSPILADHMRRETLKFMDELKRSNTRT